jgi:hypothetical protein
MYIRISLKLYSIPIRLKIHQQAMAITANDAIVAENLS